MAEARREQGIPESDYLRFVDSVERIETIRCLTRWFGPPDHRYEYVDNIRLDWSRWSPAGARTVIVRPNGSVTS